MNTTYLDNCVVSPPFNLSSSLEWNSSLLASQHVEPILLLLSKYIHAQDQYMGELHQCWSGSHTWIQMVKDPGTSGIFCKGHQFDTIYGKNLDLEILLGLDNG